MILILEKVLGNFLERLLKIAYTNRNYEFDPNEKSFSYKGPNNYLKIRDLIKLTDALTQLGIIYVVNEASINIID